MTTLLMRGLALFAILACTLPAAHAQAVWETNFGPPERNTVAAIAETADAIFYGGTFSTYGMITANNIVRVDKTTGAVTPLGSAARNGTGGPIAALAVIGTDLYVAGYFTTAASSTQSFVSANRIAKWDTTTSTWSELGSSAQNGTGFDRVSALAVIGTDLYVGGQFSTVSSSGQNGLSANNLAKWDSTTSTWSALGSSAQNGTGYIVSAFAVLGTDLYVGGQFSTVSSSTQDALVANGVAKWDPSTGTWAAVGDGISGGTFTGVSALAVGGGAIYVGGSFATVSSSLQGAISANGVAKWNPLAGTWAALGSAVQNGVGPVLEVSYVKTLAVQNDSLYVGGTFTTVSSSTQNSLSVNNIARWDETTGTWTALGSATQNGVATTGGGSQGSVSALAVVGTTIHVGGLFTVLSSSTQASLAANGSATWNSTTETWSAPLAPPRDGFSAGASIEAVVDAGSVVYVGGTFTSVGGVTANNVACWDKVTRTWSALGTGSFGANGTNNPVSALALHGTDLYVGGRFTTVSSSTQSGISANQVAKWNITSRTWSPLGNAAQNGTGGSFPIVTALAVSGTDLYVSGSFTAVSSATQSGISANSIAKWDITAETWAPLGSDAQNGIAGTVWALAVDGTKLHVGGFFNSVSSSTQNTLPASNIATWDGVAGSWSVPAAGPNSSVRALAVIGTDLYAGGQFTDPATRIARMNTTTGNWSALGGLENGANNTVRSLIPLGTALYVGGNFTTVSSSTQSGISANRIARWDLVAETWSPLGSATQNGTDNTVRAMAYGGNLYVGGSFTTVSSATQNAIMSRYFGTYVEGADIAVAQAALLTDGAGSVPFYVAQGGSPSSVLTFTLSNPGYTDLTSLAVTKDGPDAADFTLSALSGTSIPQGTGTVTFTVTFSPNSAAGKSAALHIASNAAGSKNPFDIALTGATLTFASDADNDGLNDASEFNMAAQGFNWQVNQAALVAGYYANANGAGLYTPAQVQALHVGTPLIQKDGLGQFKLTIGVQKSTTLLPGSFQPFALDGSGKITSINGGNLEFLFTVPDNAAFFRVESE